MGRSASLADHTTGRGSVVGDAEAVTVLLFAQWVIVAAVPVFTESYTDWLLACESVVNPCDAFAGNHKKHRKQ